MSIDLSQAIGPNTTAYANSNFTSGVGGYGGGGIDWETWLPIIQTFMGGSNRMPMIGGGGGGQPPQQPPPPQYGPQSGQFYQAIPPQPIVLSATGGGMGAMPVGGGSGFGGKGGGGGEQEEGFGAGVSGAAKYGSMGSVFGPWGTAAGAIYGFGDGYGWW